MNKVEMTLREVYEGVLLKRLGDVGNESNL